MRLRREFQTPCSDSIHLWHMQTKHQGSHGQKQEQKLNPFYCKEINVFCIFNKEMLVLLWQINPGTNCSCPDITFTKTTKYYTFHWKKKTKKKQDFLRRFHVWLTTDKSPSKTRSNYCCHFTLIVYVPGLNIYRYLWNVAEAPLRFALWCNTATCSQTNTRDTLSAAAVSAVDSPICPSPKKKKDLLFCVNTATVSRKHRAEVTTFELWPRHKFDPVCFYHFTSIIDPLPLHLSRSCSGLSHSSFNYILKEKQCFCRKTIFHTLQIHNYHWDCFAFCFYG